MSNEPTTEHDPHCDRVLFAPGIVNLACTCKVAAEAALAASRAETAAALYERNEAERLVVQAVIDTGFRGATEDDYTGLYAAVRRILNERGTDLTAAAQAYEAEVIRRWLASDEADKAFREAAVSVHTEQDAKLTLLVGDDGTAIRRALLAQSPAASDEPPIDYEDTEAIERAWKRRNPAASDEK